MCATLHLIGIQCKEVETYPQVGLFLDRRIPEVETVIRPLVTRPISPPGPVVVTVNCPFTYERTVAIGTTDASEVDSINGKSVAYRYL
jgi:hypothetical protein